MDALQTLMEKRQHSLKREIAWILRAALEQEVEAANKGQVSYDIYLPVGIILAGDCLQAKYLHRHLEATRHLYAAFLGKALK